jgi:DNA-binding MarR family transcriptional regulator
MMRRPTVDALLRERAEHWPEATAPAAEAMMRVFRLSKLAIANASELVSAQGLSLTEFEALASLRGAPPPHELTPGALYDAILISSGGLTKVMRGLAARGLVSRGAGEADRRSKPVRLTEKGRDIIERAMAEVLESDRTPTFAGISAAELATFIKLLRKLLGPLEETSSGAAGRAHAATGHRPAQLIAKS